MAQNTLKYLRLAPALRARERRAWNQPTLWPLAALFGVFVLVLSPGVLVYRRRERRRVRRTDPSS